MKVKYSDLKNKRVFITGGGSGIGASIVEHFCEQGSEVYFVDIDLKETKKLLNKIKRKKFRTPTFIECNLLDINKLEKIILDNGYYAIFANPIYVSVYQAMGVNVNPMTGEERTPEEMDQDAKLAHISLFGAIFGTAMTTP